MGKVRASHSSCLMYMESDFQSPNKYFLSIYICLAGEETGYPLQYSCWDNPMDREARPASVHRVTKSQILLSDWAHSYVWTNNNGDPFQYSCWNNTVERRRPVGCSPRGPQGRTWQSGWAHLHMSGQDKNGWMWGGRRFGLTSSRNRDLPCGGAWMWKTVDRTL